ncbi:MAG: transposase [Bacteroidales bacterium]|nr:transposase [Bacteroidales bacterium]
MENNIFGVDLNEESVEIAKLSLWLRTAQPRRKLNDLSSNIKCGNSLIDDPKVAGNKAFRWEEEFPNVFPEKEKKIWHVTTATHNSRYSQRMFDNNVKVGEAVWLDDEHEIVVSETILDIVKEDKLNVMAYNICGDHIHLLLICEKEELSNIVRKIKGKTSQKLKEYLDIPKENKFTLWTQKYGKKEVKNETQLRNTIEYIDKNRQKHELSHNNGLQPIVENELFRLNYEHAIRTEYKGGFDVVIGNPPYVFARDNISQVLKDYYVKNYVSAEYQVNTYLLFIEKTIKIIKESAKYGLIIPNAWLMVSSAKGLRNFILKSCSVNEIINLAGYSFEGVNVETIIILADKNKSSDENSINVLLSHDKEFRLSHVKNQSDFENNDGFEFKVFSDEESDELTKKIQRDSKDLDNLVLIKAGLQAYEKDKGIPKQTAEDVKNRPYDYLYKYDENTFKYLEGKDVGRYFTNWSGQFLQYGIHLAAPRTFDLFDGEKIIIREITGKYPKSIIATYSNELYLYNRSNIAIIAREELHFSLKYIVAVLNSQLMAYYFVKNTAKSVRKMFPKIILNDLRKFPFKAISENNQKPFIDKAELILSLNQQFQDLSNKFTKYFQSQFNLEGISKKLENWYELEFADFIKELNKVIKKTGGEKLSKLDEMEWMEVFETKKAEAQTLKAEIDKTDAAIDQMVYELYGLTEEEIKIVEGEV